MTNDCDRHSDCVGSAGGSSGLVDLSMAAGLKVQSCKAQWREPKCRALWSSCWVLG